MPRDPIAPRGFVSIEAWAYGPYEADLHFYDPADPGSRTTVRLEMNSLEGLINHATNALNQLKERRADDLARGNCDTCKNVRMIQDPDRDPARGQWLIHCPVCAPIKAQREGEVNAFNGDVLNRWLAEDAERVEATGAI